MVLVPLLSRRVSTASSGTSIDLEDFGSIVVLKRIDGSDGAVFPIEDRFVTFGGHEDNDIRIKRPDIDNFHAMLCVDPQNRQVRIMNVSKRLPITVNNAIIKPQNECILSHASILKFSDRNFRFEQAPSWASPPNSNRAANSCDTVKRTSMNRRKSIAVVTTVRNGGEVELKLTPCRARKSLSRRQSEGLRMRSSISAVCPHTFVADNAKDEYRSNVENEVVRVMKTSPPPQTACHSRYSEDSEDACQEHVATPVACIKNEVPYDAVVTPTTRLSKVLPVNAIVTPRKQKNRRQRSRPSASPQFKVLVEDDTNSIDTAGKLEELLCAVAESTVVISGAKIDEDAGCKVERTEVNLIEPAAGTKTGRIELQYPVTRTKAGTPSHEMCQNAGKGMSCERLTTNDHMKCEQEVEDQLPKRGTDFLKVEADDEVRGVEMEDGTERRSSHTPQRRSSTCASNVREEKTDKSFSKSFNSITPHQNRELRALLSDSKSASQLKRPRTQEKSETSALATPRQRLTRSASRRPTVRRKLGTEEINGSKTAETQRRRKSEGILSLRGSPTSFMRTRSSHRLRRKSVVELSEEQSLGEERRASTPSQHVVNRACGNDDVDRLQIDTPMRSIAKNVAVPTATTIGSDSLILVRSASIEESATTIEKHAFDVTAASSRQEVLEKKPKDVAVHSKLEAYVQDSVAGAEEGAIATENNQQKGTSIEQDVPTEIGSVMAEDKNHSVEAPSSFEITAQHVPDQMEQLPAKSEIAMEEILPVEAVATPAKSVATEVTTMIEAIAMESVLPVEAVATPAKSFAMKAPTPAKSIAMEDALPVEAVSTTAESLTIVDFLPVKAVTVPAKSNATVNILQVKAVGTPAKTLSTCGALPIEATATPEKIVDMKAYLRTETIASPAKTISMEDVLPIDAVATPAKSLTMKGILPVEAVASPAKSLAMKGILPVEAIVTTAKSLATKGILPVEAIATPAKSLAMKGILPIEAVATPAKGLSMRGVLPIEAVATPAKSIDVRGILPIEAVATSAKAPPVKGVRSVEAVATPAKPNSSRKMSALRANSTSLERIDVEQVLPLNVVATPAKLASKEERSADAVQTLAGPSVVSRALSPIDVNTQAKTIEPIDEMPIDVAATPTDNHREDLPTNAVATPASHAALSSKTFLPEPRQEVSSENRHNLKILNEVGKKGTKTNEHAALSKVSNSLAPETVLLSPLCLVQSPHDTLTSLKKGRSCLKTPLSQGMKRRRSVFFADAIGNEIELTSGPHYSPKRALRRSFQVGQANGTPHRTSNFRQSIQQLPVTVADSERANGCESAKVEYSLRESVVLDLIEAFDQQVGHPKENLEEESQSLEKGKEQDERANQAGEGDAEEEEGHNSEDEDQCVSDESTWGGASTRTERHSMLVAMTVVQLKKELTTLGGSTKGRKAELVKRILQLEKVNDLKKEFHAWKYAELKTELATLGLESKGRKKDLVNILAEHRCSTENIGK